MPAEVAEELPNCRLFLMPPSGLDAVRVAACVEAAATAGDVACLVLPADKELISGVMQMAQLATKLRLCPSARYDRQKANTAIKRAPSAKPWKWEPGGS